MDDNLGQNKIKYGSLVLMIFSAIFGFSNSLTAFYQMGYSSVIWYILAALLFFLPSALMFADTALHFGKQKVEFIHGCAAQRMKNLHLLGRLFGLHHGSFGWFHQRISLSFRYQRCCSDQIKRKAGTFGTSHQPKLWGCSGHCSF